MLERHHGFTLKRLAMERDTTQTDRMGASQQWVTQTDIAIVAIAQLL
jgi:hypothetical protein